MIYLKCLPIFAFIIGSAFCNITAPIPSVTLKEEHVNHTTEKTTTIEKITTALKNITPASKIINITIFKTPQGKRRTVLIINSPSILRQVKGKHEVKNTSNKDGGIQNLLYAEYNEDGTLVAEFMMNNMGDVAKFFETFLHTEVCNGSC